MWTNIITWILDFFANISQFAGFLFTPIYELTDMVENSGHAMIGFIDSSTAIRNFIHLFPNFKVIDLIGIAGFTTMLVWAIVKFIDPFGG